jgi:glutathione S-transferase
MDLHYIDGSPFARMARVLILEHGLPVALHEITEFPPSAEHLALNPLGQVPVLVSDGESLFPTRIVIAAILSQARPGAVAAAVCRPERMLQDEQLLAVILAMGDTMVARQYAHWAGIGPVGRNLLGFDPAARNLERVLATLDWLEARVGETGFWPGVISVQDVALACLILWSESRGPIAWLGRPRIEALVARLESRPSFAATVPRPLGLER